MPCQIVTDEHALEMSLAENTVRLAMHPADEFEAFARLIDDGQTAEQIAERFGVTDQACRAAAEARQGRPGTARSLPGGEADARLPDGLHHHRRPREAVAGLSSRWRTWHAARDIRAAAHRRDGRGDEQAGALRRAGRLPRGRRHVAQRPVRRCRSISKTPTCCTDWPPTSSTPSGSELEAEGWGWVEVSPDRDWSVIHGCGRIHPQPVDVPPELLDLKAAGRSRAGRASQQALEDDGIGRADRRAWTRRKRSSPRSRSRSNPSPPTTRSRCDPPAAMSRSAMTARFASKKGWSGART